MRNRNLYIFALAMLISIVMGRSWITQPSDGSNLQRRKTAISVKGYNADSLKLYIPGLDTIPSKLRADGICDFIDIQLPAGQVPIMLKERIDGKWRWADSILVFVPGEVARIVVETDSTQLIADGNSQTAFTITLYDSYGMKIYIPHPISVSIGGGELVADEYVMRDGGYQMIPREGEIRGVVKSGHESGKLVIEAIYRDIVGHKEIDLNTYLRPIIAVGQIGVEAKYRQSDDWPDVLSSDGENSEDYAIDGRGAFFMQGALMKRYSLTLKYDSKAVRKPVEMRKTDFDEILPVYGDMGSVFYIDRSTSPLYARIERNGSFIEWSDFHTDLSDKNEFVMINRTLNGINTNFDGDVIDVKLFGAVNADELGNSNRNHIVDVLTPDGSSGFYNLSRSDLIRGTEQVRLELHDRYENDIILETEQQTAFTDYEIDYENGRILFKRPVMSVDDELNKWYIVVEYEIESKGDDKYYAGARLDIKPFKSLSVGASAYHQNAEGSSYDHFGGDFSLDLGGGFATLTTQVALSSDVSSISDLNFAGKTELEIDRGNLRSNLYYKTIGEDFVNPSSTVNMPGQDKFGGDLALKIKQLTLDAKGFAELNDIGDDRQHGKADIIYDFGKLKTSLGMEIWRYLSDSTVQNIFVNGGVEYLPSNTTTFEIKRRQSIDDNSELPTESTLGAHYRFQARHSLFAIGGVREYSDDEISFFSNLGVRSNIAGVDASGQYRVSGKGDGLNSAAIIGISERITLLNNLYLDLALENERKIQSSSADTSASNEHISFSQGLTFQPKSWEITEKTEIVSHENNGDKIFLQFGATKEIGSDFTLLAREQFELRLPYQSLDNLSDYTHSINRLTIGAAYRPIGNDYLNSFLKMEYRSEFDRSPISDIEESLTEQIDEQSLIMSIMNAAMLNPRFELLLRYALKVNWQGMRIEIADNDSSTSFQNLGNVQTTTDLILAQGRFDITKRLDLSAEIRLLTQYQANSYTLDIAPEIGYVIFRNIRLGVGYNLYGVGDDDLSNDTWWKRGPFISLDVKLSERGLGHTVPK
jgi:hypothetical protein